MEEVNTIYILEMKSKELLLKHLTLNDCTGYVTSDGRLYKAIIDALNEAINYTRCCTELKVIEELKDLAYEVCPLHRTDDLDDIIERL
jgi:hypothetical protein